MYFQAIQQFNQALGNLTALLRKAQQHAEARKFDPDLFLGFKLAPDMFALTRQVQIACDTAKIAAASLANKTPPKHEDNETTFAQVLERIGKCQAYLETFRAEDFRALTPTTVIKLNFPAGKAMHAESFLLVRAIPNFYFHVMTAYALLRSGGVEIGKMDYLGNLPLLDA